MLQKTIQKEANFVFDDINHRESELHTCLGRWSRLFLRNMFLAWLHVPSMMITLCFTVPTSWFCTNSSKSWDLGPGYRMSVLGS